MNKNKSVKSNISLTSPKGSLIAEINNLRKQLKDCKQVKKQGTVLSEKPMRDIFSHMNKRSPQQKCVTSMSSTMKEKFFKTSKEDFSSPGKLKISNLAAFETEKSYFEVDRKQKVTKKDQKTTIGQQRQSLPITLNQVWLREKDRKLKMDIELNKLRKTIIKLGPQQIADQLNYLISLINVSTREYISRIQILQKNQKTDESDENLLIKRQQEEIDLMTSKIMGFEEQIRNLKTQLKAKKEQESSLQQINKLNITETSDLRTRAQALEAIAKQLDEKSIELEEQNKILESKLFKKQQQLLLLNQDVNYLRLQTENYKQQKKQFSQLYENTLFELREFKRAKSLEIQKLQEEKDKWQKQCKLRRNQSQQINALEEQKITLMKELSEMRHLCNLKTTQLQDKKSLMHQNQKKVIQLQSEVYKLRSEIQTIRNQKEFSEFQNQKIKEEFEDLRRYTRKNNSKQKYASKPNTKIENEEQNSLNQKDKTVPKIEEKFDFQQSQLTIYQNEQKREVYNRKLKDKEQKLRALEDIHSLIKKHRHQMQI